MGAKPGKHYLKLLRKIKVTLNFNTNKPFLRIEINGYNSKTLEKYVFERIISWHESDHTNKMCHLIFA